MILTEPWTIAAGDESGWIRVTSSRFCHRKWRCGSGESLRQLNHHAPHRVTMGNTPKWQQQKDDKPLGVGLSVWDNLSELWISLIALMQQVYSDQRRGKSQTKTGKIVDNVSGDMGSLSFSHNKIAQWVLARRGWGFKQSKEELVSELTV